MPLTTRPSMMGETPMMGAGATASAEAIAGTAVIGAIDTTGFEGAMMMVLASRIASTTPGAGRAVEAPRYSTRFTSDVARSRTHHSWK